MPDGRVLKGPRPEQRKNAQFWTEISDGTGELVKKVQVPQKSTPPEEENTRTLKNNRKKQATASEKPGRRSASAIKRKKDATPARTRATGPRPSQRGFKWPSS